MPSNFNVGKEHPSLFSLRELYLLNHTRTGLRNDFLKLSQHRRNILKCSNIHLMEKMRFTEAMGIPILAPNNASVTDIELYSYSNRNKHNKNPWGIHFFQHDYTFINAITTNLEKTTKSIINCNLIFAPDLSLYVNLPTEFVNIEHIYLSRFAAAYWQLCGLNVIQTASWGNANSFKYAFEGLAENSTTAVCGIGHNFCKSAKKLWNCAIEKLIEQKSPTELIVYGGKQNDIPNFGIPIQFIKDNINKYFRSYDKK